MTQHILLNSYRIKSVYITLILHLVTAFVKWKVEEKKKSTTKTNDLYKAESECFEHIIWSMQKTFWNEFYGN